MRTFLFVLAAGVISGTVSPFVAKSLVISIRFLNDLWGDAIVVAPLILFWIVGYLSSFSKRITGTGVDFYVDDSVHMRFKDLVLKYISTMVTLGLGGSGGLVAPILFIGKSMSNVLVRKAERIFTISFAAGMLSYYLGTPLTAALLSVEYFEKDSIDYDDLMPAFLASMISTFNIKLFGFKPMVIEYFRGIEVSQLRAVDFLVALPIAFLFGSIGMSAYALKYYFRKFMGRFDDFTKKIVSGLFLTSTGVIFGEEVLGLKIFFGGEKVFKLIAGKIVATVFTIESLGSAGYFTPLTLVGVNLGHLFSNLGLDVGVGASIGLSAILSSMLNVPIAAVLFPMELFGMKAIIPAAIGSSVSYIIFKRFRIE